MSNAFIGREVLAELVPSVQSAWDLTRVALREPRTRQLDLPYAVIWFEALEAEFAGLRGVHQTMRLGILGRFQFPSDTSRNVELEKLDRANELVAALQAGPTFAGALLPLVTRVTFGERDLASNAAYEVTVFFEVQVCVPHHG